jgi:transcriptional regulator with PAS, ATPase and Fis domain
METNWVNEIPFAITVCDVEGIILYMNEKSKITFSKDGGESLVGENLFKCHNPTSQSKIQEMMSTTSSNIYTIQKNGKKKMIIQTPWFENNEIQGLVEISIELPTNIPHFERD